MRKRVGQRNKADIRVRSFDYRTMRTFGGRLRVTREAHGIAREALGFEVEVTKATVPRWKTGSTEPNPEQLDTLADVLGRSADYFVRRGKAVAERRAAHTRVGRRMPRRRYCWFASARFPRGNAEADWP